MSWVYDIVDKFAHCLTDIAGGGVHYINEAGPQPLHEEKVLLVENLHPTPSAHAPGEVVYRLHRTILTHKGLGGGAEDIVDLNYVAFLETKPLRASRPFSWCALRW